MTRGKKPDPAFVRECESCPPGTSLKAMCYDCNRYYFNKRRLKAWKNDAGVGKNKKFRHEKRLCNTCKKPTYQWRCQKCWDKINKENGINDEMGAPLAEYSLPW